MGAIRNLVNELRRRGVVVHEWAGWDGRGNNGISQIDPKGAIIHHTGTDYGFAFSGLVSSTRPDLKGGVLSNFSGNADGSLTVLASGLAWHAGGGYGPNQGPLAPYANNRNYYTVGLEIVYPGNKPMTVAQWNTALVFSKTVADMFAGGNLEYIRGHSEVNGRGYEGKWDPGTTGGVAIDMNVFRREAASFNPQKPGSPGPGTPQVPPVVKKRKKRMNLFGVEVIAGNDKYPTGFACLIDTMNLVATGINAANLRAACKESMVLYFGVSAAELEDLLKKYDRRVSS